MFTYIKNINLIVIDRIIKFGFKFKKNFHYGNNLTTRGVPIIQISKNAGVFIGNNVTINSRNYGYHANMHSPTKLMADRPNAVIRIGDNTRVNGACIHAFNKIEIGNNCLIAANVQIIDANGHELSFSNVENRINTSSNGKPILVEDNVWIGLNSIILPGVKIGRGSVIGANSVVSTDVPPMVIFSGNPGKIIKKANEYESNLQTTASTSHP